MSTMKKTNITSFAVAIVTFANTLSLWAIPISGSNDPAAYIVSGRDLSMLSMGIYSVQLDRDIVWDGSGAKERLKARRLMGYVGCDVVDLFTIYAVGGQIESKLGNLPYGDSESEYGAGIQINLLNHWIRDAVPEEDVIRLNLGAQYLRSSLNTGFTTVDWDETSVALTMALVNHTAGNKSYSPESISLYFGPLYSLMMSDAFEAKDTFGAVGGIEIYLTDHIVLDFELQHFEQTSLGAGINFHF